MNTKKPYVLHRDRIGNYPNYIQLSYETRIELTEDYLKKNAQKKRTPNQYKLNSFLQCMNQCRNTHHGKITSIQVYMKNNPSSTDNTYLAGIHFTTGLKCVESGRQHLIKNYNPTAPLYVYKCSNDIENYRTMSNTSKILINEAMIRCDFEMFEIHQRTILNEGSVYFFYTPVHELFSVTSTPIPMNTDHTPVSDISSISEAKMECFNESEWTVSMNVSQNQVSASSDFANIPKKPTSESQSQPATPTSFTNTSQQWLSNVHSLPTTPSVTTNTSHQWTFNKHSQPAAPSDTTNTSQQSTPNMHSQPTTPHVMPNTAQQWVSSSQNQTSIPSTMVNTSLHSTYETQSKLTNSTTSANTSHQSTPRKSISQGIFIATAQRSIGEIQNQVTTNNKALQDTTGGEVNPKETAAHSACRRLSFPSTSQSFTPHAATLPLGVPEYSPSLLDLSMTNVPINIQSTSPNIKAGSASGLMYSAQNRQATDTDNTVNEIEDLKAKVISLNEELDEIKQENEKLNTSLDKKERETMKLKERNTQLQEENDNIRRKFTGANRNVTNLIASLEALL